MPHTIEQEEKGLYRKFTGIISGDEILESNFDTHRLPEYQELHYIINDFSDADGHAIEIAHTQAYASSDKVIANAKGQLKIAIVATRPDMMELAKNYIRLMEASPFGCQLFQHLKDARRWVEAD